MLSSFWSHVSPLPPLFKHPFCQIFFPLFHLQTFNFHHLCSVPAFSLSLVYAQGNASFPPPQLLTFCYLLFFYLSVDLPTIFKYFFSYFFHSQLLTTDHLHFAFESYYFPPLIHLDLYFIPHFYPHSVFHCDFHYLTCYFIFHLQEKKTLSQIHWMNKNVLKTLTVI